MPSFVGGAGGYGAYLLTGRRLSVPGVVRGDAERAEENEGANVSPIASHPTRQS